MQLLIVEDDALLGSGLQASLSNAGFSACWVRTGQAALDALAQKSFVIMVLDIGLPDMSGLEVLHKMRSSGNNLLVLMLTARDATSDKVISLETGADDYLVKTTDIEELIARLRALIRRSGQAGQYSVNGLALDAHAHRVTQNGAPIELSQREFSILRVLLDGAGRVVTRSHLEQSLFGSDRVIDSNALEVHIHNLRAKIGANTLKTVRGVGYTIARQAS